MEISQHELRRLVRDVDDRHPASLASFEDDLAEQHAGSAGGERSSRRQLLRRALAGGIVVGVGSTVLSLTELAGPAFAADSDADLMAFAEGVELALVTAYGEAQAMPLAAGAAKGM